MKKLFLIIGLIISTHINCQKKSLEASSISGIIVVGFVNQGAYINFTGPNISWNKNGTQIMLGMLPSLRFKEDSGSFKNSFITPMLGIGITYIYKAIALQVPFYYNPKSSLKNGNWQIGIGLGFKIQNLKTNKNK
jgi:hypothetical protein